MSADVLFSVEQHIGLITLNRAHALHALTHDMIRALHQQLQTWEADTNIHALVVSAAPSRAFCAGGDVRGLYEMGRRDPKLPLSFFRDEYRLNLLIHQLKKPFVTLMDGFTFGGGVGLGLHGSHPIAGDNMVFAMPETSIGFFPDVGASHLLTRMPHAYGLYLGLTGQRLGAIEAETLSLVRAVLPSAALPLLLADLIQADLREQAHGTIDACVAAYQHPSSTIDSGPLAALIEHSFNQPTLPAILNSLKQTNHAWAQETLALLLQKSPMSLCVTFHQLQQAQGLSLAACLAMDFGLTHHFMQNPDFYEGVRALLIDKDKSPHWTPATINEVTHANIMAYFTGLTDDIEPLWL